MKFTSTCHWISADRITVYNVGQFVHLNTTNPIEGEDRMSTVVLDIPKAKELMAALEQHIADYDETHDAAPSVRNTVPSYASLSDQAKLVYRHMERAGSISARDAMDDHGITSATLARRICDIEEEGFRVWRDRRVHPISGKRYTRYSLMEANTFANAA